MAALNIRQFGHPEDPKKVANPYFNGSPHFLHEELGTIPDEAWASAPVKKVPVERLVHTQHWLDVDKLNSMGSKRRIKGEKPEVVEHDGQLYLHDGHHRATIAAIRDQQTLKSRVLKI